MKREQGGVSCIQGGIGSTNAAVRGEAAGGGPGYRYRGRSPIRLSFSAALFTRPNAAMNTAGH